MEASNEAFLRSHAQAWAGDLGVVLVYRPLSLLSPELQIAGYSAGYLSGWPLEAVGICRKSLFGSCYFRWELQYCASWRTMVVHHNQ